MRVINEIGCVIVPPMTDLPPAILIMGPTASGKTSLALEFAKRFPVEIISVDSALVYRDMNIGTSKPDSSMLAVAPHHLIDICDPTEAYSAATFRNDALSLMASVTEKGKIPLLVGGTMLYYRGLLNGLSDLPSAQPELRQKLEKMFESSGNQVMHQRLEQVDPVAAKKIHPNDPQRIQRALEVYESTGKPISQWWADQDKYVFPYKTIKIATMPEDRSLLHKIIEQRFDEMLELGFVKEVESLMARGDLDLDKPSMRSVGYRQIWQFLEGEFNYDEMRNKGIAATRQLAKRQLTWLRREKELNWVTTAKENTLGQALSLVRGLTTVKAE